MKWSIDEKAKHRIVGLAVILSVVGAVFPFIVGKNDLLMEEGVHVSVDLPAKPMVPDVKIANEAEVFETEQVAHVELPAVVLPSKVAVAPKIEVKKPVIKVAAKPAPSPVHVSAPVPAASVRATVKSNYLRYTIQLAYFSKKENAEALAAKLKAKGFQSIAILPYKTDKGLSYKVRVGADSNRDKMVEIQKRLSQAVKLDGIIVQGVN